MDEQERVDIRGEPVDVAFLQPHVEELVELLHHLPGLVLQRRIGIERQSGDQGHHRLVRMGQIVDHARQVVFEERLALRRQRRQDVDIVRAVGPGDAEIAGAGTTLERQRLQAEADRAVLLRRERLGIEILDHDLAVRGLGVGPQQVVDPIGVGAEERVGVAQCPRHVEAQRDRLLDLGQQLLGPAGQGELAVLGQIEPPAPQRDAAIDIERHEQHDRQDDAGDGELVTVELETPHAR